MYRKLGFKPGFRVGLVAAPDHYGDLLAGVEGVTFEESRACDLDAIHLFLTGPDDIAQTIAEALPRLRAGGMLWVSWAKKSSPLHGGSPKTTFARRCCRWAGSM
ncbi:hypothetical protein AB0T83_09605 [Fluviibacterium sp. DFM31]|uniref:Methyltransferase type 11 domain-containing protein n=1 Tax=Meridianimarinicoccus marinus TaxID=3231483 RepID=A0ABV3L6B6_9RHOB